MACGVLGVQYALISLSPTPGKSLKTTPQKATWADGIVTSLCGIAISMRSLRNGNHRPVPVPVYASIGP